MWLRKPVQSQKYNRTMTRTVRSKIKRCSANDLSNHITAETLLIKRSRDTGRTARIRNFADNPILAAHVSGQSKREHISNWFHLEKKKNISYAHFFSHASIVYIIRTFILSISQLRYISIHVWIIYVHGHGQKWHIPNSKSIQTNSIASDSDGKQWSR